MNAQQEFDATLAIIQPLADKMLLGLLRSGDPDNKRLRAHVVAVAVILSLRSMIESAPDDVREELRQAFHACATAALGSFVCVDENGATVLDMAGNA